MYYRVELQDKKTKLWFGAYTGSSILKPVKGKCKPSLFSWMQVPYPVKDKHNNFECWLTEKGFEFFVESDLIALIKAYPGQYRIRRIKQFKRNEIKFRDLHQVVRLVSPKRRILKIIHHNRGI